MADIVRRELSGHAGWVAVDTAGVVGFALAGRRSAPAPEIRWAAMHPDHRNRGHGRLLVDHVLDVLAGENRKQRRALPAALAALLEPLLYLWGPVGRLRSRL